MNKHEAIWAWLQTCPAIKDLYFQFAEATVGDTQLIPVTDYRDQIETEFIDGSAVCYYDFALARFDIVSYDPNESVNIYSLNSIHAVAGWVEEQDKLKNFPEFGNGYSVESVEILADGSSVTMVGESAAKYMMQIRVHYNKE